MYTDAPNYEESYTLLAGREAAPYFGQPGVIEPDHDEEGPLVLLVPTDLLLAENDPHPDDHTVWPSDDWLMANS